jgi:hypothetical protein
MEAQAMNDEKISINLTESEYDSLEDIIRELNLRGLNIKNRSEALRKVVNCALENPEKLGDYLENKLASKDYFSPEKDGFKSEAFVLTFIDPLFNINKLKVNLLIKTPVCRVYVGLGSKAEIDRYNGGHVIFKGNPEGSQKRKNRADNCKVSFGLKAIDKVQIYDQESGEILPYHYIPAEKFPPQKILELDLKIEDVES